MEGISVVIPSYQEAENLRNLLPVLKENLSATGVPFEILCVDTMGAMDDTEEVCRDYGATYVRRTGGNNYGNAVRTGIASARYGYTVVMDGDGSHDPKYIKDFYGEIQHGYDLVIGSRYTKGGDTQNPFVLRAMSYMLNLTYRLFFGIKVKDISDSYRIYRTEQIQALSLSCSNFDIVEEILIKLAMTKKDYAIREVPILFEERKAGVSKRNLGKFILSYISTIWNLKRLQKRSSDKAVYVFSFLVIVSFFTWFLLLVHNPNGTQRYLFDFGGGDLFADFFNLIRHVVDKDPYFAGSESMCHVYLPFVYLFFYPLSKVDDFSMNQSYEAFLEKCHTSELGSIALVFFLSLSMVLFAHSLLCLCDRYKTRKLVLVPILISFVILHILQRANVILIAAAFLNYFLSCYDSENKWFRLFATVSLVFVSVMKIYPVLFGILYLQKKQWKEIFIAFILGLLLTFLPFLYFKHGFSNIPQLFSNLKGFSNITGTFHIKYPVYRICRFITHNEVLAWRLGSIGRYFTVFLSLLAVVCAFFDKDTFKKTLLIVLSVLYLPQTSFVYCIIYIMPEIILFFSRETKHSQKNIFIFLYFLLILIPLRFTFSFTNRAGNQEVWNGNLTLINIFGFVVLFSYTVVSLKEFLMRCRIKRISGKK